MRHALTFRRPVPGAERHADGWTLSWAGTAVMGILNVTPDSFSDGGRHAALDAAVASARAMRDAGVLFVDIGGESTRPGALPVPAATELDRVRPLIRALAGEGVLLSVDTLKPEVARAALQAGAHLVNDVGGLRDPEMRRVCAEAGAPACLMHMQGEPRTMQVSPHYDDVVAEVLRHGTLAVGFIGLAETLTSLIGEHHGQSEQAQQLGLRIVGHMRDRMDEASRSHRLNFSLIATPAEGLSGRFVRMDKQRHGVIAGVTDKDYYTNSFHIPVGFPITAFEKINREAPYHALTNGGHISYIELDGDPGRNLAAFEAVVRHMHAAGIGYGAINHPVDRDPQCGYSGQIDDQCPGCGRVESESAPFDRIRRITGYLVGTLDRFNDAKRAEEHDRVKHGVTR